MSAEADYFRKRIQAAMDEVEEIGGPDGADYIKLMESIAEEAKDRAINCRVEMENRLLPKRSPIRDSVSNLVVIRYRPYSDAPVDSFGIGAYSFEDEAWYVSGMKVWRVLEWWPIPESGSGTVPLWK